MARVEVPSELVQAIGSEMKPDAHWIDVRLRDGRMVEGLTVRGGHVITGRDIDPNGEGPLDFGTDDIRAVRRANAFPTAEWTYATRAAQPLKENAADLSAAIVIWSGHGQFSWPHRDESRVIQSFGAEHAARLLPELRILVDDYFVSDAWRIAADLGDVGNRASQDFRALHPEISDAAVKALAWCYTYDWK